MTPGFVGSRDWRKRADKATIIVNDVWYRSPLWEKDHCLGRTPEHVEEGLAWCGRPLQLALDGWGDPKLEGLWVTNRASAQCAECKRRDKEYIAALKA